MSQPTPEPQGGLGQRLGPSRDGGLNARVGQIGIGIGVVFAVLLIVWQVSALSGGDYGASTAVLGLVVLVFLVLFPLLAGLMIASRRMYLSDTAASQVALGRRIQLPFDRLTKVSAYSNVSQLARRTPYGISMRDTVSFTGTDAGGRSRTLVYNGHLVDIEPVKQVAARLVSARPDLVQDETTRTVLNRDPAGPHG